MKNLGTQISEDGNTIWRNNGGCIERKALYAGQENWENVAITPDTPRTPGQLKKICAAGGFGYSPKMAKK